MVDVQRACGSQAPLKFFSCSESGQIAAPRILPVCANSDRRDGRIVSQRVAEIAMIVLVHEASTWRIAQLPNQVAFRA